MSAPTEFTMPSLGADMDAGTLLEWRVGPGDHVRRGDVVAVVDTEKSTIDVEVFVTGVVEELLVQPGTEVPVGTPLATIRAEEPGHPGTVSPPEQQPVEQPVEIPPETPPESAPAAAASDPARRHVESRVQSPLVRHHAEDLGVDPERLTGTGPGGRVTRHDVDVAARTSSAADAPAAAGSSPAARRRAAERGIDLAAVPGTGPGGAVRERDLPPEAPRTAARTGADRSASVRTAIARLMERSNAEIPHFHVVSTIDMSAALARLAAANATRRPADRLLPAALLLAAVARTAARHPALNGHWVDGHAVPADGVHLGVAVSLRGGGLVTPVIRDADRLAVDEVMRRLGDLVGRVRSGSLRSSDLGGATLTVTNLGEQGAEAVFGVIHPPQVALVGFGRIVERPWAVDGMLGVRPLVTATLAGDHRAADGIAGSRFLAALDRLLQSDDLPLTDLPLTGEGGATRPEETP